LSRRFFFAAGPGNLIEAHRSWRSGTEDPSQMSVTFSSEFESFCKEVDAAAHIVSSFDSPRVYKDDPFIIEHRPKKKGLAGWRYHVFDIAYGLGLLKTAVKFKADYAFIQSGSTHYFVMSFYRLFGIKVVPIMHNTLWPSGFPSKSVSSRLILFLDALFFRWAASATLAVSAECIRQVDKITCGKHGPIYRFTIQFLRQYFEPQVEPPPLNKGPFRLLFAGRINRNKGVFDLLEIMRQVDAKLPGRVSLELCGTGPDLEELKHEYLRLGLAGTVHIRGWTPPSELRALLVASHASIVPTRSDFAEGMAMTAIEPILTGRPVITNPVVPALEDLRPACLVAKTDDVASYVSAIIQLIQTPSEYEKLVRSCAGLQAKFYDRSQSFNAALKRVISAAR
jgi:glycogen(starch) synthase